METEITCPDCGKVIAPPGSGVDPTARCRCAQEAARSSIPIPNNKHCYVCGRDLTGRKRLKDHLGRYWCGDCAKADKRAKKRIKQIKCPDCNRMVAPHKMVLFDDVKICGHCELVRKKKMAKRLKEMGIQEAHRRYEMSAVKWMAVGLTVVAIIALLQWLF